MSEHCMSFIQDQTAREKKRKKRKLQVKTLFVWQSLYRGFPLDQTLYLYAGIMSSMYHIVFQFRQFSPYKEIPISVGHWTVTQYDSQYFYGFYSWVKSKYKNYQWEVPFDFQPFLSKKTRVQKFLFLPHLEFKRRELQSFKSHTLSPEISVCQRQMSHFHDAILSYFISKL